MKLALKEKYLIREKKEILGFCDSFVADIIVLKTTLLNEYFKLRISLKGRENSLVNDDVPPLLLLYICSKLERRGCGHKCL